MTQWYCAVNQQRYGPVEEGQLREWITQGRIGPEDLVWTEGWEQWQAVRNVPQLAVLAGSNAGGLPDAPQDWAPGRPAGNGLAVAGMILGILSVLLFCMWFLALPAGIVAVVLSVYGRKRSQQNGEGGGMATAGLVLGITGTLFSALMVVLFIVSQATGFMEP